MNTITKLGRAVMLGAGPIAAQAWQGAVGTIPKQRWTGTVTTVNTQNQTLTGEHWRVGEIFNMTLALAALACLGASALFNGLATGTSAATTAGH